MLTNFKFYSNFEINDTTGETLSQIELMEKHYEKVLQLQKAIFKYFRDDMPIFPLQNIRTIDKRDILQEEFEKLSDEQLKSIGGSLQPPIEINNRELLMEVLISEHERVQSHIEVRHLKEESFGDLFQSFSLSIVYHCIQRKRLYGMKILYQQNFIMVKLV
jgi:hypothetical protein